MKTEISKENSLKLKTNSTALAVNAAANKSHQTKQTNQTNTMPKYNISINALAIQGAQRLTSKTGKDCLVIDLDASRIQRHANGKLYLNLEMSENRDGEDQYGNSHRVAEPTTKDERGQGVKLPILGNAKTFYFPSESQCGPMKPATAAPRKVATAAVVEEPEGDDIPF